MPSQPSRKRVDHSQKKKAGKSKLAKKLKSNEKDLKQNERRLTKKHEAIKTKWVDKELQRLEKKQKKAAEPEEEEVVEDIEKELAEEEEDEVMQEVEGEEVEEEDEEIDMKDLPEIPISKSNKAKLRQIKEKKPSKRDENKKSAVVYLGHIPFGFSEWHMKDFMEQFGEVQRLYISKNKKTGRSRGYGFIEFLFPEVAEIVADTMQDYLMFKKRLICKVLPQIKASNLPWPTNQITVPNPFAAQRSYAEKYNTEKKPITLSSLVDKEKRKRKRLEANNIDYKFDGYDSLISTLRTEEQAEKQEIAAKKKVREEKKEASVQDKQWIQRKHEKAARDKEVKKGLQEKEAKKAAAEEQRKQNIQKKKEKQAEKQKEKEKAEKEKEKAEKEVAKAQAIEKKKEKAKAKAKARTQAKKELKKAAGKATSSAGKATSSAGNATSSEAKSESTNPPPAKKARQE